MVRVPDADYVHLYQDTTLQPLFDTPLPYRVILRSGTHEVDLFDGTPSYLKAYEVALRAHEESGLPLWITQPNGGLVRAMMRKERVSE